MTSPPNRKPTTRSRSKSTESSPEQALRYALRLLADRDYTLAALKRKLELRQFRQADLEEALVRLEREGWVSDRRFAERFAECAISSGRYVGARLRLEMLRRGVPEELVEEQMQAASQGRDEEQQARELLSRRFPDFSFAEAGDGEKRRVAGFLQRRGFRFSAVMQAMKGA